MSNFNAVDYLVLIIFGLSMLAGISRGFLKEAISVASWVAAAVVATTFASTVAAMFSGTVTNAAQSVTSMNVSHPISLLSLGISFIALFIGTLFIGSVIGYIVSGAASAGGLGFFNRILGAGFGLVRGYIMVIIFMFVAELTPLGAQPAWAQSVFVQDFAPTVKWFSDMVHPGLQQLEDMGSSAFKNVTGGTSQTLSGAISSFTGK